MKKQILAAMALSTALMCFAPAFTSDAAWKVDSTGRWYTNSSSQGYVTGWKKIGKYTYYFEKTKYAATGWKLIEGSWFCFDAKGRMLFNRWVDGFYLGSDGKMKVNTTFTTSKGTFTVDATGMIVTGTLKDGTTTTAAPVAANRSTWSTKDGEVYYYRYNGKLAKGWFTIKDKLYYFDPDTGARASGRKKINGKYYFFNSSTGVRQAGWVTIGKKKYYFSKNNFVGATGWKKIDKKRYYFNAKGVLQRNKWIGDTYYVDSNGVRAQGLQVINGASYYFNEKNGKKMTGWIVINKKSYYFNEKGVMQKSTFIGNHYVNAKGQMVKKYWIGQYYINRKGVISTKKSRTPGLWTNGGKTYYLDSSYEKVKSQWVKTGGKYYYFNAAGVMQVSQWVNGYYIGANGARVVSQMLKIGDKTYLFKADGSLTKGIAVYGGSSYLFNTRGEMQTGWYNNSVATFYFSPSTGKMLKSTSVYINDVYYVFDKNGYMLDEDAVNSNLAIGAKIAAYAQQFIGNPYVYGGTSLTKGADCSGFTQSVMKHFGISIPRVADQQAKGYDGTNTKYAQAKVISVKNIQPGDLVFYYSPISHVGIYIGDGKIVHASNSAAYPAGGIKISTYNYATIRAIIRYW